MAKRYDIRRTFGHWLLMLLLLVAAHDAHAQAGVLPEFEVDAINARSDEGRGLTRLDVYTKVPYSKLRFLNSANGFTARYEVTTEVFPLDQRGRRQNLALTRIWESSAVVNTFAATRSDQLFDHTTHSLDLEPGAYILSVKLEDADTKESFVKEVPVVVRDLNMPVAVSDIILLDEFDEATKTITPSVDNLLGIDELGLGLFYEVYSDRARQVRVTREIVQVRKGSATPAMRTILGVGREEAEHAVIGTPVYQVTETTSLRRGRNQTIVETVLEELKVGDYHLRVRVEDLNGQLLAQAERAFNAEWTGLADHVRNLDDAISQLQYIAKDKELKRIKGGSTSAERLQQFQQFWQRRDPTPGTARNERMEEYYYRISFANREYGAVTDGWKTDRGQVLVLFGEPDYIERHPYNFNVEPYQVWYYYRIGKQFIFIDKTGFGDYQLLVPIWDERNRIR